PPSLERVLVVERDLRERALEGLRNRTRHRCVHRDLPPDGVGVLVNGPHPGVPRHGSLPRACGAPGSDYPSDRARRPGSRTVAIAARTDASASQSCQPGRSPSMTMPEKSPITGISITD